MRSRATPRTRPPLRDADIALSGPPDVHWVIHDFLTHHEGEPARVG